MKKAKALLLLRNNRSQDLENPLEQLYMDDEEETEQLKLMFVFLSHAEVTGLLKYAGSLSGEELQRKYLFNKYLKFLEAGLKSFEAGN